MNGTKTNQYRPCLLGTYKMDIKENGHQVHHEVKVFEQPNKDFILGMDFIEPHKLYYDPSQHTYHWGTPPSWMQGDLSRLNYSPCQ